MKKLILSILIIITMLSLSIPVSCVEDDPTDIPVGGTVYPVIEANSLEDFSAKLNQEIKVTYDNVLAGNATPEEMSKLANKRVDKGEDYVYIPDIDCEIIAIRAYIMALRVYPETYRYEYSRYGVSINSDSEVAFDTTCTVKYDGMEVFVSYNPMVFSAEYLYEKGSYKKISLHDLELYYDVDFGTTEFLFRYGDVPLSIRIFKELTDEEIKALPRGMFYPKAISITDIKNGDFSAISGSIDIDVDDPKESYDVECIIG